MPKKKELPPPLELVTLPGRLKYARERAGLSVRLLGELADMDPGQVSRIETGERAVGIEAATLLRLAHALGVPFGWLGADEGTLPPAPVFREPSDRRRKAHR